MLHRVGLGALLALCACSGDGVVSEPEAPAAEAVVGAELLASTWPVRMSDDAARARFEQHPGWAALFKADNRGALEAFSDGTDPRGLARTHAQMSALYRQAAWMGAQAARNVYGADRQATDPIAIDHLVGVSEALAGDCAAAAAALSKAREHAPAAIQPLGAAWTTWAGADGCPSKPGLDDLGQFPGRGEAVAVGADPGVSEVPHLSLPEQGEGGREVHLGELSALYTLALGHEAAARSVVPEGEGALVDAIIGPWLLGADGPAPSVAIPPDVDDAWLFLSFALAPGDRAFLAEASTKGLAAVDAHLSSSVLASALAPAIVDGQVRPDAVIDRAADLRIQIRAAMEAKSGTPMPFQPPFARLAEVAVLRAGMLVADANDQFRDAGILRVNALERAEGPSRDAVFLVNTAAWDAGNRSPLRAQEIVHGLLPRYPALRAARYSLDALHIRVGRNSAPSTPVH